MTVIHIPLHMLAQISDKSLKEGWEFRVADVGALELVEKLLCLH